MAVRASQAARDRALPNNGKDLLNYSVPQERAGKRPNMRDCYEIASSYVDAVEEGKMYDLIVDRGYGQSTQDEAEEAWWMMILPGMIWGLSVSICTTDHRPEGKVPNVPSYLWQISAPVWHCLDHADCSQHFVQNLGAVRWKIRIAASASSPDTTGCADPESSNWDRTISATYRS